ncbi:MAG: hypothetical protein DWQ04_21640 [Chloroflexi bacterium]|nr:MAG: hypothetical protein DWQ04_21640 [Chloroflexota bacterium]
MEDKLEKLNQVLTPDYNSDFWSDQVKSEAGILLDTLQEDDWTHLLNTWQSKPAAWCIRLVEASLLSEKPRIIRLLVALLKRPEAQVGAAVAAMLLEKDYQWSPEESLLSDLERHLTLASQNKDSIQRLMSRLPA